MTSLFQDAGAAPFFASIPPFVLLAILGILALWTVAIKGFALWHAARNRQIAWFVVILVVNTLGLLELVYLLAFRKDTQSYAPAAASSAPEA